MSNKKALMRRLVPEVDLTVGAQGITLKSSRFTTSRFVPYDKPGKCSDCAEADFITSPEGVTLFCTRIKGEKFIRFDRINALPGFCMFRLRTCGRAFNIPYGEHVDE